MGALALVNPALDMWTDENQLKEIRKLISPEVPLNDIEFNFMTHLGRATQLNPFMKEIWAVKYKQGNPAQIFIGRDGYRKVAQRQRDYEYHQVDAVYSKDEFKIVNNEVHHSYGFCNRGELIGAYCIIKRKSSSKPTYVMVTMAEYNQNQSLWKSKPETMIKKVAEAQALRQAFQEALAGTYSDAEMPQQAPIKPLEALQGNTQTERLLNMLKARDEQSSCVFELVQEPTPITEEQLEKIVGLLEETNLTDERIDKALEHFSVNNMLALTTEQAAEFINNLEKIKQRGNHVNAE